ncbi:hypothetical protein [Kitasatospora sp. NPDC089509]|uniref:hypothetical protein n=1 Tax=Kitasatospora sp. NPDC089509 TaxID=3364079 RepID=UPI0038286D85
MSTPSTVPEVATLSVNHDDLKDFAYKVLAACLTRLETDPGFKAMMAFAGKSGVGKDALFTELLTGQFESGIHLHDLFASNLAGSVLQDFTKFHQQLAKAQDDIWSFLQQMDAAHEDALTAAEMMQILQDVIGAGSGSGGGGGGGGGGAGGGGAGP